MGLHGKFGYEYGYANFMLINTVDMNTEEEFEEIKKYIVDAIGLDSTDLDIDTSASIEPLGSLYFEDGECINYFIDRKGWLPCIFTATPTHDSRTQERITDSFNTLIAGKPSGTFRIQSSKYMSQPYSSSNPYKK